MFIYVIYTHTYVPTEMEKVDDWDAFLSISYYKGKVLFKKKIKKNKK